MSSSNARKRAKQVLVRLSDEEYAVLAERADAAELTLPDYLRSQALGAEPLRARGRPSVDRVALGKLLGQIGAIGGNVNQIARNLNSGRGDDHIFMAETMAAVRQMREAVHIALGLDPEKGR